MIEVPLPLYIGLWVFSIVCLVIVVIQAEIINKRQIK